MNALVHRDYQAGARVSVQVLNDRAVIKSPGEPLLLADAGKDSRLQRGPL